jgi:hypothetical protein
LARNLATPCLGREPKAKVATTTIDERRHTTNINQWQMATNCGRPQTMTAMNNNHNRQQSPRMATTTNDKRQRLHYKVTYVRKFCGDGMQKKRIFFFSFYFIFFLKSLLHFINRSYSLFL